MMMVVDLTRGWWTLVVALLFFLGAVQVSGGATEARAADKNKREYRILSSAGLLECLMGNGYG